MDFPSRQPNKLRPRVDFDPEKFRKFIFLRGMNIKWSQAARCPCIRLSTDVSGTTELGYSGLIAGAAAFNTAEARPDCTLCKGNGWFQHSTQQIKALVAGAKITPQPQQTLGDIMRGDLSITTLPEHLPSMYDQFELIDSTIVFHDTALRGATTLSTMRYPIISRALDLSDGPTAVSVLQCRKADTSGEIVAGELVKDTDFTVTSAGKIDWTIGDTASTAPTEGQHFSVSYYCHPRYVVIDIPNVFRDTFVKKKSATETFQALPVQCSARLDFIEGTQ